MITNFILTREQREYIRSFSISNDGRRGELKEGLINILSKVKKYNKLKNDIYKKEELINKLLDLIINFDRKKEVNSNKRENEVENRYYDEINKSYELYGVTDDLVKKQMDGRGTYENVPIYDVDENGNYFEVGKFTIKTILHSRTSFLEDGRMVFVHENKWFLKDMYEDI